MEYSPRNTPRNTIELHALTRSLNLGGGGIGNFNVFVKDVLEVQFQKKSFPGKYIVLEFA